MKKRNPAPPVGFLTRRQVLSYMGLAGLFYSVNPLRLFTDSIVDGLIAKAQAADGMALPRNYIVILLPGAPPRYVWDSFLAPRGIGSSSNPSGDSFVANNSLRNWITDDKYSLDHSKTEYRVEPVVLPNGRTIHLPPLWNRAIPTSDGSSVMMSALLSNALMIRGVDMQVDLQHGIGPSKIIRPGTTGPSLTGLVADAAPLSARIPALSMTTFANDRQYGDPRNGGFFSERGLSTHNVYGMNVTGLERVLSSFRNDPMSAPIDGKFKALRPVVNEAMRELASFAKSSHPGADNLFRNRDGAEELFFTEFGNLQDQYSLLAAKYSKLEQRCAEPLTNLLPATGTGRYNINSTQRFSLAGQFAIAEFLLKKGLTTSITMNAGGASSFAGLVNTHDEHAVSDRQLSMIVHGFEFRVISALIQEMRRSLIEAKIWDETVIQVGAEYDRRPSQDLTGSDHAPSANLFTLFSGAIKEPVFIGNIKIDSLPGNNYSGTWGSAAPVQTSVGTRLITKDVAVASVAELLRVKSPVRTTPVISVDASGVKSLAEDPKNV